MSSTLAVWAITLKSESLPKTKAFFEHILKETKAITNIGKNHWKRTRPYADDPEIHSPKPEKSFSYPSGHSTRGTVCAAVLADLFPEKRDAILAAGCAVGWHRIQIGVHYPSDVYAGRVLGHAIAQNLFLSESFQEDLAEVRAELAAAAPR